MKQEAILAQLKAFQLYLKNHIEDSKSRPTTELDESGEIPVDEQNANFEEYQHISDRYNKIRDALTREFFDVFEDNLEHSFKDDIRGFQFMLREIEFALDTISNLNITTSNQSDKRSNFKLNNQPFTSDEVQIINNQLDDLQTKLIDILDSQNLPQEKSILIESVKSEIGDLKAEVTNPTLGRKDWKNHLINTMITLTFTLSFSQEARTTIYTYFHALFVYLQQHIFLLEK